MIRCVESDLVDEPDGFDEENRPLNKCFEDEDMYRTFNIALMNSHVDFSQEKAEDIITYSVDSHLLMIDPNFD